MNQVKEVMQQNVDQMLATHEKLEDLETKVDFEEECDGGVCGFGGHGDVFASFRAAPHSARNAVGGGKSKGGGEDVQALRLQSELQLQQTQQVKPVIAVWRICFHTIVLGAGDPTWERDARRDGAAAGTNSAYRLSSPCTRFHKGPSGILAFAAV